MLLELNKYLIKLYKKTCKYRRTKIEGNVDKTFWGKYLIRFISLTLSLLILFYLPKGFPDSFIEHISGILSILVGLFITALIFSFDKFYSKKKDLQQYNDKLNDTLDFNFTKIFTNITSYTIVLSIFCIVIVSLYILFNEWFNLDLEKSQLSLKQIDYNYTLQLLIVCIVRLLIIYTLINIIYNTIFIVVTMNDYMNKKLDK